MASLPVDDLSVAVEYYERNLGFRCRRRVDGAGAVMALDGAGVHLRQRVASDPERVAGDPAPGALAAILSVADVDAVFEELIGRGVQIRESPRADPTWGRIFVVEDRFGHLLGFVPRGSPTAAITRTLQHVTERARSTTAAAQAIGELRPELARFRAFYDALADQRDIFYTFFTSGLMHWAVTALCHVPEDVNVVVLCSGLEPDELAWARARMGRPVHHIDLSVNDWPVWDILLQENRRNFGWLDIDCLVLEPGVLADLTAIGPDTAINSLWSFDSGHGFRLANTYALFVNIDAVGALRERRLPVWGRPHHWRVSKMSDSTGRTTQYRVPSRRERAVMSTLLPPDEHGRPSVPHRFSFFDTLVLFQILARTAGFGLHMVRDLRNPTPGDWGSGAFDTAQWMSDEVLHVGGIGYYYEYFHDPAVRARYLCADRVVLAPLVDELPERYTRRLESVDRELREHGLEPEQAWDRTRDLLSTVGGLSLAAVRKALGPGTGVGASE